MNKKDEFIFEMSVKRVIELFIKNIYSKKDYPKHMPLLINMDGMIEGYNIEIRICKRANDPLQALKNL